MLAAQNFAGFGLDLLQVDDTGPLSNDNLTSVALPTVVTSSLNGLAITVDSQIEILRGGVVVGSYTVVPGDLAGGVWAAGEKAIPLSASLQEGANSLTFRNREGATVGTASTTPLVVTLDTSSPTPGAPGLGSAGIRRTGDVISFDITFSEPVIVSGTPQLSIAVGTAGFGSGPASRLASYASGAGTNTLRFNYTVDSGVPNDVDGIGVAFPLVLPFGASIVDAAGNAASLGSGSGTLFGVTVLTSAASLTMTTLNNPNGGTQGEARATPVPVVDLDFSAPVAQGTGAGLLELADFELTRDGVVIHGRQSPWPAYVALIQSGDNPRQFQISNLSQITEPSGTYILTFADAAIGPAASITWVKTGPTPAELTAVMALSPAAGSPRRNPVDSVQVTFQDVNSAAVNVIGVSIDDFTFSRDGGPDLLAAAAATGAVSLTGSGNTYVINGLASLQRDPNTGEPLQGSYRLALPAGAVTGIVTLANGQLLAPVEAGWNYDVEPTVQSVTVATAPGTLPAGAAIEIVVQFSETVFVDGTPTLPLAVGGTTRQAAYVSGHGTDTLRFAYTVVAGDEDRDGIGFVPVTGTTRYEILGGTIRDDANSAARREFVPPVATGVLVDAVRPSVISGNVTGPLFGHYVTGDTLVFRVAFDESVVVSGDPGLQLTINGSPRTATLTTASLIAAGAAPGSTFLEFEYEIGPTDFTSPSVSSITVQGIELFNGSIRDVLGNDANVTPFVAVSFPLTVNRVAPTVSVSPPAAPATAYRAGDFILFNVSYGVAGQPRSVTVSGGVPEFSFQIGSRTALATYIGGSQSSTLVFRSVVQANDLAPGGITIPDPTIRNGTIVAEGTSGAVASLFVLDGGTDLTLVTVDAVAPRLVPESVTTPAAGAYATGDTLAFAVEFDEPVIVTGSPRLSFTLGQGAGAPTRQAQLTAASALLAATAPGTTRLEFEYSILSTDSSITGVRVTGLAPAGGTIRDLAGNAAVTSTLSPLNAASEPFAVNATGVVGVTTESGTYRIGSEIVFVVEFSGPVTASGTPQIPMLFGTASRNADLLSGSGTSTLRFRYVVRAGDAAPNGILLAGNSIAGGTITAVGGTPAAVGFVAPDNLADVVVDGIAPRAFAANGPTPGTYVTQTPGQDVLRFTVLMDDTVNVVAAVNPTLQFLLGSNTRQAVFAGFGFGDTTGTALLFEYEVQPGDSGQSVTIQANPIRLNGATIRDAAGNDADLSGIIGGTTNGVIVNLTTIQIETDTGEDGVRLQDPATQDNRYYRAGETIFFEVSFTAPVSVTGAPSLLLAFDYFSGSNSFTSDRNAFYVSGSGTNTLLFAYTVRVGDVDQDGLHFRSSSIQLNGGTITNAGGNVQLSFVPPVITGVRVDAVTPRLLGTEVPPAGRYKVGDLLQFSVRFDESMKVDTTGGIPYIAFVVGSNTERAMFASGDETPVLTFEYTVETDDLDTNGILASTSIVLNGGTITDLAGNTGSLLLSVPSTASVIVDGVAPTLVRFSTSSPNGRYTVGGSVFITATVSEAVQAGSALEVQFNSGGTATLTAAADGTTLTGAYIVAAGENTPPAPGDRLEITAVVDLGVLDLAGNALDTTLPAPANMLSAVRNIVIDTLAPTVLNFSSTTPAGAYGVGATINVSAEVSEPVQAGGSFIAVLDTGATVTLLRTTSSATMFTGSFTVSPGQNTTALLVTGFSPGSVRDLAGNAFESFDVPANNIDDVGIIVVDTTAPRIVDFGTTSAAGGGTGLSGIYVAGDEIFLTATASEDVRAGSSILLTLDTGAVVSLVAAAAGTTLEGSYVVPAGHSTAALNVVSFTAVGVLDAVGNVLTDTAVPPGGNIADTATLVVDSRPPTLASITASPTSLRKGQTATITFTFSEPVLDFTTIDVTRVNGTIGALVPLSATVFTTLFTPDDNFEGLAEIAVAANRVTDVAGNGNASGNSLFVPVDTRSPTVSITDDVLGTATGPVTFTFIFSEPVSGFSANGVVVSNGTKGTFTAVTTAYYTLQVIPTADAEGVVSVTLPAGVAFDTAGNPNTTASASQAFDTLAPSVVITDDSTGTATGPVTFTFTFSEPVSGLTADDVGVTGGTKGTFTTLSGSVYTLVVTPFASQDGSLTVSLPAGAAVDAAGNPSRAATATQAFDTLAPSVVIASNATGTATGPVTFTFTFSEPVTGFTADDVMVTGGTKAAFAALSSSIYTLVVTPPMGAVGSLTVALAAGVATDAAGNQNGAASAVQAFDTLAPALAITDNSPAIAKGPVTFTFTFSESVTGFTTADVTVSGGVKGAFTAMTDSAYTLVVTPAANSVGTIAVSVPAGAAVDAVGNPSGAASAARAFDTQAPTLAIADNATGTATGPVTFTFTFSEPVTGFTADDVTVTNGSKGTFTAVSDSFYSLVVTPAAGVEGVMSVAVSAGAAADAAGNPSAAASATQAIDTLAPRLVISSGASATATGPVTFTFTFTEPVSGFTADDVTVSNASKGAFTIVSGSVYTLVVTPTAGAEGAVTATVAAGAAADAAGNASLAASAGQVFDTLAPTILRISGSRNGTLTIGNAVVITATLSEMAQPGGTVSVRLNTGVNVVLTVTGGGMTATGTYVVAAGQSTADLNVVSIVPNGSLRDLAGNALTITQPPQGGNNLADQNNIVVNGAIQVKTPSGFGTSPTQAPTFSTAVSRIRISFNTPVTGVSLAAFRLFLNGRSLSLRGAQIVGQGAEYTLVLPPSLTQQRGLYNLRIGPNTAVRAANGVSLTTSTNIYWNRR